MGNTIQRQTVQEVSIFLRRSKYKENFRHRKNTTTSQEQLKEMNKSNHAITSKILDVFQIMARRKKTIDNAKEMNEA